jgi:thiaminase/transcriptional activator TenA
MGLLLARSPFDLSALILDGLIAMKSELELFEREAARLGVDLTAEMDPACLDYVSFLQATAERGDLVEGWAAFYGQEQAYLDSWRQVKSLQTTASPYQSFIDNWTSDGFVAYVDSLATALDGLALGIPARARARVERTFRRVIQYEIRFWDMALGSG